MQGMPVIRRSRAELPLMRGQAWFRRAGGQWVIEKAATTPLWSELVPLTT